MYNRKEKRYNDIVKKILGHNVASTTPQSYNIIDAETAC